MTSQTVSDNTFKNTIKNSLGLSEELLDAWLDISIAIRNERFVSEFTYNESIICKLLIENWQKQGDGLTATELCRTTLMKKSQMNRTLTTLEEHGMIIRKQSETDHRRQPIEINPKRIAQFEKQHARIIEFVDEIADALGPQKTQEAIRALENLTQCIRKISTPA